MYKTNLKNQMTSKELNPKSNWDSFANELSLLTKYYKTADDDFINGMKQYCTDIRKGFARSRYYPEGYSLNNQWVIDSFNKTFEPLLTRLFPEHSHGWMEFALAQIQLPLAQHLSRENLHNVADKLKLIETALEEKYLENNNINQYVKEASTIGLLANILYYLNNKAPKHDLVWCECCWRRAHKSSNYCLVHKPKSEGSNNNNKMGKKIFKEISSEFDLDSELSKVRAIRYAFNCDVKIINHQDEVKTETLSNIIYISTQESVKALIDSTINNDWSNVSILWDAEIKNEFPYIDAMLLNKASSFLNWNDFISSIRTVLNEEVENCSHPYWLLCELSIAERWVRYESHVTNSKKIDEIVLAYSRGGYSVSDIMSKVDLKKSRIYQIIKYANRLD